MNNGLLYIVANLVWQILFLACFLWRLLIFVGINSLKVSTKVNYTFSLLMMYKYVTSIYRLLYVWIFIWCTGMCPIFDLNKSYLYMILG